MKISSVEAWPKTHKVVGKQVISPCLSQPVRLPLQNVNYRERLIVAFLSSTKIQGFEQQSKQHSEYRNIGRWLVTSSRGGLEPEQEKLKQNRSS